MTYPLGNISHDTFLSTYWQKEPLVIRKGFNDFIAPISPDELAGLACEPEVNARLVQEYGATPWHVDYAPLEDEHFTNLPETHWTLLVNDVEKYRPDLAWIVDAFRFIPEWLIDDLMISYAPKGGSVGPHQDLYDVFILQAQGHRHWQLSTQPVAQDNHIPDIDLCIQRDFQAEMEWILAPGDIIYIPPGVSHHGVAQDDCMSFSIGFRAPAFADMAHDLVQHLNHAQGKQSLYRSPELALQNNAAEITQDEISRMYQSVMAQLTPDQTTFQQWLGQFLTENTSGQWIVPAEKIIRSLNELDCDQLFRHPASRFAYITQSDHAQLYVDGQQYPVSHASAQTLCQERSLAITDARTLPETDQLSLVELYNQGHLVETLRPEWD